MHRIGYLVPEFPAQTHSFFWRELRVLPDHGVRPDLVSTRRPASGLNAHRWGAEAQARTTYLTDRPARLVSALVTEGARAGPIGWARCLRSIARAQGVGARGRLRLMALAMLGARLADLARRRDWGHVHVHSCADAAHVAMFAHLWSGLPYSLTLHGPLADYGANQPEKWRHASFALVITQQLMDQVADGLAGFLPPRLAIAPMGVDLAEFHRAAPYRPWTAGPLRIVSCGRLNPGKGHADLIDAVGLLRRDGVDAHLVIAGEDEGGGQGYHRVLQARIDAARLCDAATLLGAVDEQVVRSHLEQAHLFALASVAEPLGVAIMEAMAMQVPVVVTGAGGVPELVADGIDGVLVAPGDPPLLARALASLADDPERARRLSDAGRATIEARFASSRGATVLAQMLDRRDQRRASASDSGGAPANATRPIPAIVSWPSGPDTSVPPATSTNR